MSKKLEVNRLDDEFKQLIQGIVSATRLNNEQAEAVYTETLEALEKAKNFEDWMAAVYTLQTEIRAGRKG